MVMMPSAVQMPSRRTLKDTYNYVLWQVNTCLHTNVDIRIAVSKDECLIFIDRNI